MSLDTQDARTASSARLGQAEDSEKARELTSLVNSLRSDFEERNKLHEYVDSILFRTIPVTIPDAYKKTSIEVHNPLAMHIANTVTAALSKNPPSCQFQPVGFGDSYQENASQREHFFDSSWTRQEEEAKRRLFRIFMYSLVTKGEAVLKTVERTKTAWSDYAKFSKQLKADLDADEPDGPYQGLDQVGKDAVYHAKTEEAKRGAAYPIRTTFVAPSTFAYIRGEDGITLACEVKEVPYTENLERFGYALDSKGKVVPQGMGLPSSSWSQVMGKKKTLKLVEVWTDKAANYLLVGPGQISSASSGKIGIGTLVKSLKHGYGDRLTRTLRGPYFHALGTTTDSSLPERAGLSILYGYLDLFPLLDSLLTIRSNAAFLTGFPAYKRVQAPGTSLPPSNMGYDGSEENGNTQPIIPGAIYPFDVEPIQHPAAGPEFSQFVQELRTMMETALPAAAQGNASAGDSGYAINQAAYSATLAWDPIIDNAEIALGERMSFESWMIENRIRERVYVWGSAPPDVKRKGIKDGWLGMGPQELNGVHRYKVTLNPETPSNKIIDIRTHAEMLQLRLETREDAITELGGNPDEVERAWLLYDLKQDPAIKSAVRDRFFAELSTIDQKKLGGPQVFANSGGVGGNPAAAPGSALGNLGQVFMPGQNGQPLTPTPAGSGAGAPGSPAGAPGPIPNPPPNALPQPGQGSGG